MRSRKIPLNSVIQSAHFYLLPNLLNVKCCQAFRFSTTWQLQSHYVLFLLDNHWSYTFHVIISRGIQIKRKLCLKYFPIRRTLMATLFVLKRYSNFWICVSSGGRKIITSQAFGVPSCTRKRVVFTLGERGKFEN